MRHTWAAPEKGWPEFDKYGQVVPDEVLPPEWMTKSPDPDYEDWWEEEYPG